MEAAAMTQPAPIALFVYARPAHTRRTLQALASNTMAHASPLYVFSDAAKSPDQSQAVAEVRALIREIEGFKSVKIIERERNWGLAASIIDGVTQLCEEYGRCIVVEDDLIVAPNFLDFLNLGLERYADEPRVYQVSGYMYPGTYSQAFDALFLPMISCWGWATWARAWQHFDAGLGGFEALKSDKARRRKFNLDGAYDYYGMAEQQYRGAIDSWGICWHLSVFLRNGLVLYPVRTLVENEGVDNSGTHGAGHAGLQSGIKQGAVLNVATARLPKDVVCEAENYDEVKRVLRAMQPGLLSRGPRFLKQGLLKQAMNWMGR